MQNEDTTKYIIKTKITADGVIERPDIVGAIFGQTEGLLGTDLDLRELQKTGRIGRIEVMVTTKGGKTRGNIFIPSSLDKVKTSVLAASLETIDRVGPCVANIEVNKIEDVRASKRVNIVERAKDIYKTMFDDDLLEAQEITEAIRESVRVEGIASYGKNKLPAGPEYNSNDIIVVEGRADILTLLKYGIKNTISVGGTNIPPEVVELLKGKKVTVFTDGDRGGELIIRELMQVADVEYIARPADGKAVEDMIQKEIVLALRRKMTTDQYIEKHGIVLPAGRKHSEMKHGTLKSDERNVSKRTASLRKTVANTPFEEETPIRRSRIERLPDKPERIERRESEPYETVKKEERPIRQLRARSLKPKIEEDDSVRFIDSDSDISYETENENKRSRTGRTMNERSPREREYQTNERAPREREYQTNERAPREREYQTNERAPREREYQTNERSPREREYQTNERSPREYQANERTPRERGYQTNERAPREYQTSERSPREYQTNERSPREYQANERTPRERGYQTNERPAEINGRQTRVSFDSDSSKRSLKNDERNDFIKSRDEKFSREKPAEKKSAIPAPFDKEMASLAGTFSSKVLDEKNNIISEMPVRELADALKSGIVNAKSVVFDGTITQRIVDIAADQGVQNLIGLKTGNVVKMPANMKIFAQN